MTYHTSKVYNKDTYNCVHYAIEVLNKINSTKLTVSKTIWEVKENLRKASKIEKGVVILLANKLTNTSHIAVAITRNLIMHFTPLGSVCCTKQQLTFMYEIRGYYRAK